MLKIASDNTMWVPLSPWPHKSISKQTLWRQSLSVPSAKDYQQTVFKKTKIALKVVNQHQLVQLKGNED